MRVPTLTSYQEKQKQKQEVVRFTFTLGPWTSFALYVQSPLSTRWLAGLPCGV